jgi:outer membrane receptor for ferrienterochelin and colicin
MLKVRGTWSTSFLAPSLVQRFTRSGAFQNGIDDGVTAIVDNLARVPLSVTGNPNLDPQESTAWNLGTTIAPLATLSFDLDYWHFDFQGLISAESAITIARDSARDPSKVVRDISAGTVIDPTTGQNIGAIVRINQSFFNAAKVATAGFDLAINHRLDIGRFGTIRNNLMATYVDKYDIQLTPTSPVVDGSDNRNNTRAGAALSVDLRATLRTTWSLGNHSVQSLVRYTDAFVNDNLTLPLKPTIPTFTVWDLNYGYDLPADTFGLATSNLTVGINNVLERNPPVIPDGNGSLPALYDYTGRYFWMRVTARL